MAVVFATLSCGGISERTWERQVLPDRGGTGGGGTSGGGGIGSMTGGGAGAAAMPQVSDGGMAAAPGGSGGDPALTPSGYPRCGALVPEQSDACDGIDKIIPLDPSVSSSVDGSIQHGLLSHVFVWVRNTDDRIHDNVCVGAAVDTPGIELLNNLGETNPMPVGRLAADNTGILAPTLFQVGYDVEPGTVARFTTWTTYRGTDCVGPTAVVEALVKPSPFSDY